MNESCHAFDEAKQTGLQQRYVQYLLHQHMQVWFVSWKATAADYCVLPRSGRPVFYTLTFVFTFSGTC